MTNPNTHPAPTMVHGGAPSFKDADPVEQYHAAPSEFPNPGNASYPYPQPALDALRAENATLRADNDALKAKWEAGHVEAMETRIALNQEAAQCDELRADNDARGALIDQLRADLACTATELDTVRSERDALLAEMNEAYEACTKMARQKDELHHAVELANARADRQAARAELAEAETARQQRLVALFVRVLREMTPEAE